MAAGGADDADPTNATITGDRYSGVLGSINDGSGGRGGDCVYESGGCGYINGVVSPLIKPGTLRSGYQKGIGQNAVGNEDNGGGGGGLYGGYASKHFNGGGAGGSGYISDDFVRTGYFPDGRIGNGYALIGYGSWDD